MAKAKSDKIYEKWDKMEDAFLKKYKLGEDALPDLWDITDLAKAYERQRIIEGLE